MLDLQEDGVVMLTLPIVPISENNYVLNSSLLEATPSPLYQGRLKTFLKQLSRQFPDLCRSVRVVELPHDINDRYRRVFHLHPHSSYTMLVHTSLLSRIVKEVWSR